MKPPAIGMNWRTPAKVFADRLWEAHGVELRDLPAAGWETRVRELASFVGATHVTDFPGSLDDAIKALDDYVTSKAGQPSATDQLAGAW